jgi:hypothetical protein
MSTGLDNPDTTRCNRTRAAARSAADGVRGAPDVVVGFRVVPGDPVPGTDEVVVGERGAVDGEACGFALLLHAPSTTTAADANTLRVRM